MRKFLALCGFHLRVFARNGYFVWLTVGSTLSLLLLQSVAAYAAGVPLEAAVWLRAGVFGLWSCATTAAGAVGFQRFQGTLPYLLNSATSDLVSLAALLVPAASFGLLSFPLAFAGALLLGAQAALPTAAMLAAIAMLWLGAVVLDFGIAAFFVLTPNALVYEELTTLPIMLAAGLFTLPPALQGIGAALRWVLPIAAPVHLLLEGAAFGFWEIAQFAVSTLLWLVLSCVLARRLLDAARAGGKLGVM